MLAQLPQFQAEQLATWMAPGIEELMPEEHVATHRGLALARARRLAEAGAPDASRWLVTAASLGSPRLMSELVDQAAALVAIGHSFFDKLGPSRAAVRAGSDAPDRADGMAALASVATAIETLLEKLLPDQEPAAPPMIPLAVLATVAPLAIRVGVLRWELASPADESLLTRARDVVARIERGLELQPAYGRGWAMVALWHRVAGENDAIAAGHATHFGAGELLHRETLRISNDLGLTEDAG